MVEVSQCAFALDVSDALVEECFAALEDEGIDCLTGAIPKPYLAQCRAQVEKYLTVHGHQYFSIIQPYLESGSAFAALAAARGFDELLRRLRPQGKVPSKAHSCTTSCGWSADPTGPNRRCSFTTMPR